MKLNDILDYFSYSKVFHPEVPRLILRDVRPVLALGYCDKTVWYSHDNVWHRKLNQKNLWLEYFAVCRIIQNVTQLHQRKLQTGLRLQLGG